MSLITAIGKVSGASSVWGTLTSVVLGLAEVNNSKRFGALNGCIRITQTLQCMFNES